MKFVVPLVTIIQNTMADSSLIEFVVLPIIVSYDKKE